MPLLYERMTVAQTKTDPIKLLQRDVGDLKVRVKSLESERPGRKPLPLVVFKQRDVCSIEPDSNSAVCPYASVYRYQHGCHGILCREKQHDAYERRKATRVPKAKKVTTAKAPAPTKRVIKKSTPVTSITKRPAKAAKRVAKAS